MNIVRMLGGSIFQDSREQQRISANSASSMNFRWISQNDTCKAYRKVNDNVLDAPLNRLNQKGVERLSALLLALNFVNEFVKFRILLAAAFLSRNGIGSVLTVDAVHLQKLYKNHKRLRQFVALAWIRSKSLTYIFVECFIKVQDRFDVLKEGRNDSETLPLWVVRVGQVRRNVRKRSS